MPTEEEPSNAVLLTKLDGLRELMEYKFAQSKEAHEAIGTRLDKLNGQVAKNTEFRVRGSVYFGGAIFVASVIVAAVFENLRI